jgi:hypothetical protein
MRWVAIGVALPVIAALLVYFVYRSVGATSPRRPVTSQVTDRAYVSVTQSDSIDLVRRVVKRDLTTGAARLERCGGPRIACVRMPLALMAFGSRAAAGMLSGLSSGLPVGDCRSLVLGSGNMLAALSSDADEMWRALGDRSRFGRQTSTRRYDSIREMVEYIRGMLGRPAWSVCAPPRAEAA